MDKAYINWSGGKDSSLALYYILQQKQYVPVKLLTAINAVHNRISMHGVRREMLMAQAEALHISVDTIELPEEPGMTEYETLLKLKLGQLKKEGFEHTVFGDIFLADLRQYREDKLKDTGITPLFPLWKLDTRQLVNQFIDLEFKAIVVCINEACLDKSFCGRKVDRQFINDLPAGIDPCGENGEFHTFVYDGPVFHQPVDCTPGEIVYKEYKAPSSGNNSNLAHHGSEPSKYGCWFCDLY